VEGRGIARHDYPVKVEDDTVGKVTSGTLSPTLNKAIGLALVSPGVEDRFEVVIRDRSVEAHTVELPFYNREKR
jgi:aminomethyltransferase